MVESPDMEAQVFATPPRRIGRPPAANRDRTRRALIDAAGREIATIGYEAMTLESVATRVGVTRSAVYRYFKSKRELARIVLLEASPQVEEYFAQESANAHSTPERVRALVRACVRLATETPEAILGYFHLGKVAGQDPQLAEIFEARSMRVRSIIDEILQAGIESGDVRPTVDRRAVVDGVSGIILGLAAGVAEAGANDRVRRQMLQATELILATPDWLQRT